MGIEERQANIWEGNDANVHLFFETTDYGCFYLYYDDVMQNINVVVIVQGGDGAGKC